MVRVLVILFLTFAIVASSPFPRPQEDEELPQPPAPGSKPPDFLASLPNEDEAGERSKGVGEEPVCGPTCMLVNQTPIILLICILVLVILLLIILFGCYFMKKLHGKAIFTTGQRHHRALLGNERDVEYLKSGGSGYVEKQTFESVTPGKSETKSVVTTTTTKIIQSGSATSREAGTLESPLKSTDRII